MTEHDEKRVDLDPMIRLDDVTKVYRMGPVEVRAVNGINLSIYRGEMVAIMGASGSGKSTLMNIMGCLDVPTSGHYLLDGEEVGRVGEDRLADIRGRKIGFVFQTYNLLPRLTAQQNVEMPLMYGDLHNRGHRALEALAHVGLERRAKHHPTEMSGGEQQRVGIARALVKNPVLLLADEPTGNLDTHSTNELLALFQRLHREQGLTIVIITHEPDVAEHTQRIVTVRDGQVIDDAPVTAPRIAVSHPTEASAVQEEAGVA